MRTRVPKLRRHKTGQAFVRMDGRNIYLGRFDLPEAEERYHRLIAEWLANGRQVQQPVDDLTVTELLAHYWTFALTYYVGSGGRPTGEIGSTRAALKPVRELYGRAPATAFGPVALRAVRENMISLGWSRGTVNSQVSRVRRVFRWAVAREMLPGSAYHALQAVEGLKRGRSAARETPRVVPVLDAHIDAVAPHVSRQVWALIQFQLLTGARPGEAVCVRPREVDRTGKVWTFSPLQHKGLWRGHTRTIYIGPRTQEILKPFLFRDPDAWCFSPTEAEHDRRERMHARRVTPAGYGNRPGTNRKRRPAWAPGSRYTVGSYRRAIHRACDLAEIDRWSPHRLRHNAGTRLRRELGLEAARVVLGHRDVETTEIYAEVDAAKAIEAVGRMG